MANIDVGGAKNFVAVKIPWEILDNREEATYKHDLNSDLPFPFADNSVDNYYTSHTLEHVNIKSLLFVFNEFYRTLKKGGILRIVVPDFSVGMKWYTENNPLLSNPDAPSVPKFYPPTKLGKLMAWMLTPGAHCCAFDAETLVFYLKQAGFTNAKKFAYNVGNAVFQGKDKLRYQSYSLYIEAQK